MRTWLIAGLLLVGCDESGGSLDASFGLRDGGPYDSGAAMDARFDGGPGSEPGDTCASAGDVTAGGTFVGTTATAVDDYAPSGIGSCPSGGAGSGPDVAYVVRPSVTTSYRVTVTPTDAVYDPMLYAQASCGLDPCLAGTILNGAGEPEEITFSVAAGETLFVIVDGELLTSGSYELSVVIQ